jgi:hypothetical protein
MQRKFSNYHFKIKGFVDNFSNFKFLNLYLPQIKFVSLNDVESFLDIEKYLNILILHCISVNSAILKLTCPEENIYFNIDFNFLFITHEMKNMIINKKNENFIDNFKYLIFSKVIIPGKHDLDEKQNVIQVHLNRNLLDQILKIIKNNYEINKYIGEFINLKPEDYFYIVEI